MHVHPVGSVPHDPVIVTTPMDRTVSLLTATGLLMSGLLFVLLTIWFLNLDRARPLRFGGGDMGIEVFAGTPSPPVAQAVTSPDDVTDDPSARLAASDWAELVQLMERISTVTEASLVEEPPGGKPGSGPGKGAATGELVIPPNTANPERWVFVIEGIKDVADYAQLLQQFRIEVGTFDADNRFAYLDKVTRPRPTVRRSAKSRDERFFTFWKTGSLVTYDATLFRNAGLESRDNRFVHFFPAPLEQALAELERKATRSAGKRSRDIRRTWFSIDKVDGRFRFRVSHQQWK